MTKLTSKQYKIFEQIVKSNQRQVHSIMKTVLKNRYDNIKVTNDYIYAIGNIPIALVAHMDTVHATPVEDLYYDTMKNVMWSPQGLGADDRAGVFAILEILQTDLRPHIILTTDEEKGCVGAGILSKEKCPFENLKYLIQLDRRNDNDCVFYDCSTKNFIDYIQTFGFVEAFGTFSDISMLCPAWEICGVNLSIGYQNEHTKHEYLNVGAMLRTIKIVKNMLRQTEIPDFKYEEDYAHWYNANFAWGYPTDNYGIACYRCKKVVDEYNVLPVRTEDKKTVCYCIDCVSSPRVKWCKICGEAFLSADDKQDKCRMCRESLLV